LFSLKSKSIASSILDEHSAAHVAGLFRAFSDTSRTFQTL